MPTTKISSLATIPDLASGDLIPGVDISDISLAPTGTNKKIPFSLFSSTLIAALNIGVANGVASLDSGGKIPISQLPSSVVGDMQYQGTWNATTNTPTIPTASSTNKGQFYVISVAGTTTISGVNDWQIGDWIVSNGTQWDKVDNTDLVTMVAGRIGAITLTAADIGAGTFPGAISGTSASFSGTVTGNLFSGSGASLTNLNASNIASGTLLSGFGGTGQTTYARGDFIYASAVNTLSKLGIGSAGKFIRTDGTDPSWQSLIANDIPATLNATTHPTITLSSGTIVANASNLISQTWNSNTNLFRALDINIINTASSSTSKVLDLRSNGTSVFSVDISGNISANTITCPNGTSSSVGTLTAQVLIATNAIQGDGGLITGISASNVTLGVLAASVVPTTLNATTFPSTTLAAGTITTTKPNLISQTWNAAGTVFNAFNINITNTASSATSTVMSQQLAGVPKWSQDVNGNATWAGTGSFSSGKFAIDSNGAITVGGCLERVGVTVDGGSSVPSTGTAGIMVMPYNGTIYGWTVFNYDSTGALVAASTTWDVKKAAYSTNPTTATMIATGTKPNTSSARVTGSNSGDITGGVDWAVQTFSKGDFLEFYLSAIATAVKSTLIVYLKPS